MLDRLREILLTIANRQSNQVADGGLRPDFSDCLDDARADGILQDFIRMIAKQGPCDRKSAEDAISGLYTSIGKKSPPILWFSSPPDFILAMALWDLMDTIIEPKHKLAEFKKVISPVRRSLRQAKAPSICLNNLIRTKSRVSRFESVEILNRFNSAIRVELGNQRSVQDYGVALTNGCLESADRSRIESVWSRVIESLNNQPKLKSACVKLQSFFDGLDQSEFAALTNAHRSIRRQSGCLVREYGFNIDVMQTEELIALIPAEFASLAGFQKSPIEISLKAVLGNVGWFRAYSDVCFVMDRPCEVHLDGARRLDKEDGPALRFPDGWCGYFLSGIPVTEKIVRRTYTVEDIDGQRNVEVRRLMIGRYGVERFLLDSEAQIIHEDRFGRLYRRELVDDEPLVMVQVFNKTAEPDGSFSNYFLRVHPDIRIAREAVAWSFGLESSEYCPERET